MFKKLKAPVTANFIITRNCNGNCAFCGVSHQSADFREEVQLEKLLSIVDKLYEAEVLRINYFGGEPTVYPKLLSVMEYSKKLKFYNSIVTNGLYVPKDIEKHKDIIDALAISVHGLEEQHCKLGQVTPKQYNNILNNLLVYQKMNIPITVNMTVTPDNYKTIPEFVDYMLDRFNIGAFAFNRYIPSPSVMNSDKRQYVMDSRQLNESLVKIDEAAARHTAVAFRYAIHFPYCIVEDEKLLKYVGNCGFGQNYISIDCDGNLQTCSYSDKNLGNIFTEGLVDIWNNHNILSQYRSGEWLPDRCRQANMY